MPRGSGSYAVRVAPNGRTVWIEGGPFPLRGSVRKGVIDGTLRHGFMALAFPGFVRKISPGWDLYLDKNPAAGGALLRIWGGPKSRKLEVYFDIGGRNFPEKLRKELVDIFVRRISPGSSVEQRREADAIVAASRASREARSREILEAADAAEKLFKEARHEGNAEHHEPVEAGSGESGHSGQGRNDGPEEDPVDGSAGWQGSGRNEALGGDDVLDADDSRSSSTGNESTRAEAWGRVNDSTQAAGHSTAGDGSPAPDPPRRRRGRPPKSRSGSVVPDPGSAVVAGSIRSA